MNNELTYDWLDFLAEQKPVRKSFFKKILKEAEITQINNNLNRSPRTKKIEGIVIHHTAGGGDANTTLGILQNRGFSTNYVVDQKGEIFEYINPDEGVAWATGEGANEHTVAIDVITGGTRRDEGTWPSPQVQALKSLVNSLAKKYGFELKLAPDQGPANWSFWQDKGFTLFRHRNFKPTECPSTFPMDQLAGPAPAIDLNIKNTQSSDIQSSGNTSSGTTSSAASSDSSSSGPSFLGSLIRAESKKYDSILKEQTEKKLFNIVDQTDKKIYSKYKKYFDSLLNHLKKELKINKTVKIVLEEDEENAKKVLGRTGGYINHEDKIHIFCSARHIKDIMRSLAHEMVHHKQNLRGEFKKHSKTVDGYAQKDKHLRAMEKEAYLKGNILFRDWEDNYKYRGEK